MKLLTTYDLLWLPSGETPSRARGLLLFFGAVLFPVALGMGLYLPEFGKWTIVSLAVLTAGLLFFDVYANATLVFPLMFFAPNEKVVSVLSALFLISFIAWWFKQPAFSMELPTPKLIFFLLPLLINSYVRGIDPFFARHQLIYAFILPLLFLHFYYNLKLTTAQIWRFLMASAGAISTLGWIGVIIFLISGGNRVVVGWPNVNFAGCIMGIVLPVSVMGLLEARNREEQAIWALIGAGLLGGMLVTQTRAALVSTAVALFYLSRKDRRLWRVMLPILLISGIAAPALIIPRMAMLFGHGDMPDWSAVGRVQVWTNSLQLVPRYFFTGMGMDSFRTMYQIEFPHSFIPAIHAHNLQLRWLFDLGVFGMLVMSAFVFIPLKRGLTAVIQLGRARLGDRYGLLLAINAGVISGLVSNLFDATMYKSALALLFWIFIALQFHLTRTDSSSPALETAL